MECPICDDVDLKITERQGIEIDYCPKCRGVWLDRGELDKIIERAAKVEQEYETRLSSSHHHSSRYDDRHDSYASKRKNDNHYRPHEQHGSYTRKRKNDDRYRDDRYRRDDDRRYTSSRRDDDDDRYADRRYKKRRRKSVLEDIFDIFD